MEITDSLVKSWVSYHYEETRTLVNLWVLGHRITSVIAAYDYSTSRAGMAKKKPVNRVKISVVNYK